MPFKLCTKGPGQTFNAIQKNFDGEMQLGAKEGKATCENMKSIIKSIFHYNQ